MLSATSYLSGQTGCTPAVTIPNCEYVALFEFRSRVLRIRPAAVIGIFFAVDRCHMGRIFIKIRSPDFHRPGRAY